MSLSNVLGAANSENGTTVVAISNGSFTLSSNPQVLSGNIIISGGLSTSRRRLEGGRSLRHHFDDVSRHYSRSVPQRSLALDPASLTVIEAAPNQRHFVLAGGVLRINYMLFLGSTVSQYSGGIELRTADSSANLVKVEFLRNTWQGDGGALEVTNGASAIVGE